MTAQRPKTVIFTWHNTGSSAYGMAKDKKKAIARIGCIGQYLGKTCDGKGASDMMDSHVILLVWIDSILKCTKEISDRKD